MRQPDSGSFGMVCFVETCLTRLKELLSNYAFEWLLETTPFLLTDCSLTEGCHRNSKSSQGSRSLPYRLTFAHAAFVLATVCAFGRRGPALTAINDGADGEGEPDRITGFPRQTGRIG